MPASTAPACRGEFSLILAVRRARPALAAAWLIGAAPAGAEVGAPAPALTLPPLEAPAFDGPDLDARALAGSRALIVHFFATWCEACRAETRALGRLAARLDSSQAAVVAVDVGEPAARVSAYLKREFPAGTPFPVLLDQGRAAVKAWGVVGLPTSFALDSSGRMRAAVAGAVDWDAAQTADVLDALSSGAAASGALALPLVPLPENPP